MNRDKQVYLRVGNKLYRGKDGGFDFSHHRHALELVPPETEVEIMVLEIVDGIGEEARGNE